MHVSVCGSLAGFVIKFIEQAHPGSVMVSQLMINKQIMFFAFLDAEKNYMCLEY